MASTNCFIYAMHTQMCNGFFPTIPLLSNGSPKLFHAPHPNPPSPPSPPTLHPSPLPSSPLQQLLHQALGGSKGVVGAEEAVQEERIHRTLRRGQAPHQLLQPAGLDHPHLGGLIAEVGGVFRPQAVVPCPLQLHTIDHTPFLLLPQLLGIRSRVTM